MALANKESLVVAGELINELISSLPGTKPRILPIGSEHSAIFQCIQGEQINSISKLTLTASGGPFLNHSKDSLAYISLEEALNHPNWKMFFKLSYGYIIYEATTSFTRPFRLH